MSVESSSPDRSPTAETLISELGRTDASGVLELRHDAGGLSYVWVREGRIYAMQVPGYRPALGIRLLSGGLVSPEQLSTAAAEQRERRPGHLIGEVLVGMGFVGADVIDAFVRQQVIDQVADLLDLPVLGAEFHAGRHIRQGLSEPSGVEELLTAAHECRTRREDVLTRVGGPGVVPVLGPPLSGPTQTPLGPYDWALLCRVDGTRDLTELARVCGFTVVEAAQVVADLTLSGLLALPEPDLPPDESSLAPVVSLHPDSTPADPQWRFAGTDAGEPDPMQEPAGPDAQEVSRELLAEFGALLRDDPPTAQPPGPEEDGPVDRIESPAADPEPVAPPAGGQRAPLDPDPGRLPEVDAAGEPPREGQLMAGLSMVPPPPADPGLSLVQGQEPRALSLVDDSPRPGLAVVDAPAHEPMPDPAGPDPAAPSPAAPDPAPPAPAAVDHPTAEPGTGSSRDAGSDTSAFMRELSSLSDDPERAEPVVTRLVVPLTEHRRKRRPWSR